MMPERGHVEIIHIYFWKGGDVMPPTSDTVFLCLVLSRVCEFFFFFFLLQRVQHLVYRTFVREFSTERSVGCEGATRAKLRKVAEVESTCFRRQDVSCCVALHLLLGNTE